MHQLKSILFFKLVIRYRTKIFTKNVSMFFNKIVKTRSDLFEEKYIAQMTGYNLGIIRVINWLPDMHQSR